MVGQAYNGLGVVWEGVTRESRLWPHEKLKNRTQVPRLRLLRPRLSEYNQYVCWIAHIKTFKMIPRLCSSYVRKR